MAARSTAKTRLADATLRALANKSWVDFSLTEIAKSAKVSNAELMVLAPAKPLLVGLVLRRVGEATAKGYKPSRGASSAHDRLFDVCMAWFDALARHENAIRSLYLGLRKDPLTLLRLRGEFVAAAEWLMTLAGADRGPALSLRAAGLAAILGRAIPTWLDDDADLTKTMAQLDQDLSRGESLLGRL